MNWHKRARIGKCLNLAPAVGFEPTTNRLTADRSTTELRWKKQYPFTRPFIHVSSRRPNYIPMAAQAISFEKVRGVENLYRYSNGTFYARFIRGGTEYRRSLKTKDKETAKRELATLLGLSTDERAVTLAQLVERHKDSIQTWQSTLPKRRKASAKKFSASGRAGAMC